MSDNQETIKTFQKVLSNRRFFWTFISLIALIVFILILAAIILSLFIESKTEKIRITETGAIIIEMHSNRETASFLLSSNGGGSCTPWINTGIRLSKGDRIKFKYSGKINIGMHKMINAAIEDTILPPLPWSSAEGIDADICEPKRDIRYFEKLRKKCLLRTNLPQGRLIGTLSSTSRPEHRPNTVIDVPKFTSDFYTVAESGTLWLTINEPWLDNESLMNLSPKLLGMDDAEFNFIKANNYSNVWYDDNSGFFNVTIEIDK